MGEQLEKQYLSLAGLSTFDIPAVAAASAGACTIVTEVAISGLSAGALTIAAQPDYARTLKLILTDANASITGATVLISGVDANGEVVEETVTLTGAGSFYSVNAYAKVTAATWTLVSGAVTNMSDTIAIGYGPKLGLNAAPGAIYQKLIKGNFNGADEAGTFDATYGTYTPAGTLNGAKPVEVLFRYKIPIVQ